MEAVLKQLRSRYPNLTFRPGDAFDWSPETQEIIYKQHGGEAPAAWSLLHETCHALLDHTRYGSDVELLLLEVAAWDKARQLGAELGVIIDEDYVQDCLDTYRDWLYARSICPRCGTKSIQQADLKHYRCFNCHELWRVSPSRFCRAYRATKRAQPRVAAAFDALAAI